MAGLSLTLTWVDDELEKYWLAACDTPAFRRGSVGEVEADTTELNQSATPVSVASEGSDVSKVLAGTAATVLKAIAVRLPDDEETLGKLDSVAGDGDHGMAMRRGSAAAHEAAAALADQGAGAQTTLAGAGSEWSEKAGGTSGALWGAILTAVGNSLGDQDQADQSSVGKALSAALDAVVRLGGAKPGDKTLVDALHPAVQAFEESANGGGDLKASLNAAADAAQQGADATKDLVAKVGRSRPLGEKSLGTPDPGATSLATILRVLADQL